MKTVFILWATLTYSVPGHIDNEQRFQMQKYSTMEVCLEAQRITKKRYENFASTFNKNNYQGRRITKIEIECEVDHEDRYVEPN